MPNDNSRGHKYGDQREEHLGFEHNLVDVAPHPVFARLDGLHDGVLAVAEMLGGMLVFGRIAAADVAAFAANAEMHPSVAHLKALFAALGLWLDVFDLALMPAGLAHEASWAC
jgi:hypothetical protein